MSKRAETTVVTPDPPDREEDWRQQVEADLLLQVKAGGALYGYRRDGAYVARTSDGDRIISRPAHDGA